MSTTITSIIPKRVNPDLQKERNKASFNVEEFASWWHGGAEQLKFKRELEEYLCKDLKISKTELLSKSHDEIYNIGIQQATQVAKKLRKMQHERNPGGTNIWPELYNAEPAWGSMPAGNPFIVQHTMVLKSFQSQATEEQYAKWGKRIQNFEICCSYAQTELGHGTFLRGLESRADYDRKTDEFVLNMPTLTSYKWWPGGLGHSSNYALLVMPLYIDSKPKGVQMFWVQLRDEETHMPLPGIDIGDIGNKMGFYGVNNGYLGLKNVRIPRTNMLMRNAKVLPDGTFVQSPASVLTYFTMVYVRCVISCNNATVLAIGATIATRYSAVRRQSPINPDEPEPQIIDHVTQQLKLFPEIAGAIACKLASDNLWQLYDQTLADIKRGDYARLPEMHALSCILKVLCSSDSAAGIDRLRMACGGHGYMIASNLGPLFNGATAACTYEGENTVLLLQVGRFLMKSWRSAITGQPLVPSIAYMGETIKNKEFGRWTGDWGNIVKALEHVAAKKTGLAFENMTQRIKSGQTEAEAANNTGIELTQAAELHGRAFVCGSFLAQIIGPSSKSRSSAINKVLENLLELYLVHTALKYMSDILRYINLTDAELRSLQSRLEDALRSLRSDAVAIVDGFDFPDTTLSSALGAYDGNVYERLFELAKKSPLNREPVPKSFHEHLKPFMKSNM